MSDWLSEIEAWEEREKDEDIRRMASVLREQAVIFNLLWASIDAVDWEEIKKYKIAYGNLSCDAKELLR